MVKDFNPTKVQLSQNRLLPDFVPIHPGKMWVHSRQVYLSMGWLYCEKFKYPKDSLVEELRAEIYVEDYESIQWSAQRNNIAAVDLYCPHTYIHDFVFGISLFCILIIFE